jgi:TolB-like protein
VVKRTGDGALVEFRSVVDAVRCAIEVQNGMIERNAGLPPERRIEFRIGIHLGDIVEESDGDLMGDGVNIAARLEGIAKPGAICLSEDAYRQVRDKIAAEFTDLGDKELKNIARPMRAYAVQGSETTKTPTHQGFAPLPGASSLLSPVSLPPRLSIVVLPFANLGGDPAQEYFVDGVTESLTTDLSRISGSFVIARNTAFTYKGKHVDVKQIGRELGVRYVLEGSVQRGGNRMRVNVQLIDAETGNHLWAERFDKPLADLFDMQDEIVARLAGQLGTQLIEAEARRAQRTPLPDSMDLYFQGVACVHKGLTPENMAQARGYYEQALALDPGNIEALVGNGLVDLASIGNYLTEDRAARAATAEAALTKVLSLGLIMPWPNTYWVASISSPIAPRKASPCANMRSRWTEIWPVRIPGSGWPRSLLDERRKPKAMSLKRCALARAIRMPTIGCFTRASQSSCSAATRKPPFGYSGPSRPIEIFPSRISISPSPGRILAG